MDRLDIFVSQPAAEQTFLHEAPMESQGSLLPVRLRTREIPPPGAHVALVARADDENLYVCKDDRSGLPCRMREAFFSQLAREVNIATPAFKIVEDETTEETFFGSKIDPSTADNMSRIRFLRTEKRDELGRYPEFPGRWLSQLFAFDMFIGNWDRSADNIIAIRDGGLRLKPIDFSAAEIAIHPNDHFPDGNSETIRVARNLRTVHGFFEDSALQTLSLIEAVPITVLAGFFRAMPTDWINRDERDALSELWSGPRLSERLSALRSGLIDGRLL